MRRGARLFTTPLLAFLGIVGLSPAAVAQPDQPPSKATAEAPAEAPPSAPAEASAPAPVPVPVPEPAPVATLVPLPPPPPPTPATVGSLKIETANNNLKIGILAQPQFEVANAAVGSGTSRNLFMRRIRLLFGGTLFGHVEYFIETDAPNLFKAGGDGTKATSAMVVQDAYVTFKFWKDMVKADVGYTLPALAHNALQSAASLFALDYFSYSFLHSNGFGAATAPVGRDFGVQLRGLLLDGLVEYRAGMFQGKRSPQVGGGTAGPVENLSSRNSFRFTGRLQINLLDPETGFYYAGTYLGAKRILSVGGSYDYQHYDLGSYKYWAVDGFLDLPVGPGVVTAQVNFAQWNGGGLVSMPKQHALMSEAGFRINELQLSPVIRFEQLWIPGTNGGADKTESRYSGGLAFWLHGHNSNVKAFYSRVTATGIKDYNVFNLQWQTFFF